MTNTEHLDRIEDYIITYACHAPALESLTALRADMEALESNYEAQDAALTEITRICGGEFESGDTAANFDPQVVVRSVAALRASIAEMERQCAGQLAMRERVDALIVERDQARAELEAAEEIGHNLLSLASDIGSYYGEDPDSALTCIREELAGYNKVMWAITGILNSGSARPDDVEAAVLWAAQRIATPRPVLQVNGGGSVPDERTATKPDEHARTAIAETAGGYSRQLGEGIDPQGEQREILLSTGQDVHRRAFRQTAPPVQSSTSTPQTGNPTDTELLDWLGEHCANQGNWKVSETSGLTCLSERMLRECVEWMKILALPGNCSNRGEKYRALLACIKRAEAALPTPPTPKEDTDAKLFTPEGRLRL